MLGVEAGHLVQCLRSAAGIRITISRVALREAGIDHAAAWRDHVLPRLYAFAKAVQHFRTNVALRYAYLLRPERRTALILEHCPHLASS